MNFLKQKSLYNQFVNITRNIIASETEILSLFMTNHNRNLIKVTLWTLHYFVYTCIFFLLNYLIVYVRARRAYNTNKSFLMCNSSENDYERVFIALITHLLFVYQPVINYKPIFEKSGIWARNDEYVYKECMFICYRI